MKGSSGSKGMIYDGAVNTAGVLRFFPKRATTIALRRARRELRKTGSKEPLARNVTGLIVHERGAANGPRRAIGPETAVSANFSRETFRISFCPAQPLC